MQRVTILVLFFAELTSLKKNFEQKRMKDLNTKKKLTSEMPQNCFKVSILFN